MASTPSSLSELTVICRQCGSAGMERIGPREYRCTHCGAITVVGQESDSHHATEGIDTSTQPADASSDQALSPGATAVAESVGRHGALVLFGIALLLSLGFVGLMHACGGDDRPTQSAYEVNKPSVPTVPASQLTITPAEWAVDPGKAGRSGSYTGLLTNHSAYAVTVPVYSMSLYLRGAHVATSASSVALPTLLPGEYEPISFAFQSPSDDPHPEITAPPIADRADRPYVRLEFRDQQLVRVEDVKGYRVVGVVENKTSQPAKNIVAAVMLFDSSHSLIGSGSYKVNRALRAGERTAIQVDISTTNVNPVASYEYLIDAVPDTP